MKLRDYPEVFGNTIVCEDVRYEADGKVTLVGCYPSTIFVRTPFPLTIPKLCFGISLLQRREFFDPNIEIQIFLPGDPEETPSFRTEMREKSEGFVSEQLTKQMDGLPVSDQRVIEMQGYLAVTPVVFKEPGFMNVRALRKGELIRLGGVRVVAAPTTGDVPKIGLSASIHSQPS